MGIFGRKHEAQKQAGVQSSRVSGGWRDILKHLSETPGQRVLDFGPTSPANVTFLTGLGHNVYTTNLVQEASRPEWQVAREKEQPTFDVAGFSAANLDFSGRTFDVVLLWDVADYLPAEVAPLLFDKVKEVLLSGGHLLAFFHVNTAGTNTSAVRYQVTDTDELLRLPTEPFPLKSTFATRQIESFLNDYSATRFVLGKDNVREVAAVR